ncbi:hypothetical protein ONZ43_g6579 [Nemania bipapillata]|uniref:Uncharacterized protein n=1 Tax=Nemania bipapillata TaxID=110536 RepID=A0ACC2HYY7_9PEZI|nr:hypothetical protein ONZ43_g6579 [Nemania bipapillata]
MSNSAKATRPEPEDKFIDLVSLAKGPRIGDTSKPQKDSGERPVILKPPKIPVLHFAYPEEEEGWEHELEFGFGSIWSEYERRHLCENPRDGGDCTRDNGNAPAK